MITCGNKFTSFDISNNNKLVKLGSTICPGFCRFGYGLCLFPRRELLCLWDLVRMLSFMRLVEDKELVKMIVCIEVKKSFFK